MSASETRTCLACNKTIRGRTDKKFCDDYCRNGYNNQRKSTVNNFVRNVNHALLKNRRILESLLPANESIAKATRDEMLEQGFRFNYLTHTYRNKKGNVYFFCYDYGYLPIDENRFLLVKRKE